MIVFVFLHCFRYQYKHPETGPTRTEYTAGERGFRARGTDIARQMDLSQSKIPYNPPVDPNSPNYNPTYDGYHDPNEDPSYKFKVRTPTFVKDEVAGSQGQVQGSYTYTDDVGEVHRVDYEAGAGKGFRVRNPVPDNTQNGFYYGGAGVPPRGRSSVQQGDDGSYTFVAQGPNLRRAEKRDNLGHVAGSYSYIDDKGVEKTVSYIAGPETGYQVVSKVPKEFIPLFQPGYFAAVTPIIPFPTNFPKFPSPAFPSKNKPTTTFAPLFPSSTTTYRPPAINPFPSAQKPSSDFDDLFDSSQPTESSFLGSTPSSPSGGGGYNSNNNGNKNNNNYKPSTPFPSGSVGDFNDPNKGDGFLNPQSNIFNSGAGYGGSTPSQGSNIRPSAIPNTNNGNDFLTGPNINSVSNQIPVISFPVDGPNNKPGDYSNICKVCRNLKDKSDNSFYSNQGYRPTYTSYGDPDSEFNGFPHGVAVRAHVQSIDLYPFGSRVPEPGEAIDSLERIDRSSPEVFDREILYTTPTNNLISSLHNSRLNSLPNEFSKIKSDRIVAPKIDYNEKSQKNKLEETQNVEFSTYRGNVEREDSREENSKNKFDDLFKDFNVFNNQTSQLPSSNSQQKSDTEESRSFNEKFDTLFQPPQNLKVETPSELVSSRGNLKSNNTATNQNAKLQVAKSTGPNLLELLQKEVRSRPIYVPDFPEGSNNKDAFSSQQEQLRNSEFSFFDAESSTTTPSPETVKERNPPRGRQRGSTRYSRYSNKENKEAKPQKRRGERKTQ